MRQHSRDCGNFHGWWRVSCHIYSSESTNSLILFMFLCVQKLVSLALGVPLQSAEDSMEPTLVVIGISLRSAKLAMRERFLMDPSGCAAALGSLVRSEAIDEVIVQSNCNRT